jgi:endoglucanase
MNEKSLAFLKKLLTTPGPSGFEREVAAVWRDEAATCADEVDRDLTGNSFAWLRADPTAPTVLIEGHIDEIGVQVMHIDDEGYLWIDEIGGWDAQVLLGQRIVFAGAGGPVTGVIGRQAIHLMESTEREKAVKLKDLWADIGASSRADAEKRISVGDSGVVDGSFVQLNGEIVSSRALDNRTGAWVALEVLRLLADERPFANVVAVAATQEEVSFGGAHTATFKTNPMVAIAIDVTHATDYPGADKKRDGDITLGGGPVLSRGASISPVVFERLVKAAQSRGINIRVQGAPKATWTDADAMIKTGPGPATGVVSIPTRYMHSPNETISLADLDTCAALIAEFVRQIDAETDFRP